MTSPEPQPLCDHAKAPPTGRNIARPSDARRLALFLFSIMLSVLPTGCSDSRTAARLKVGSDVELIVSTKQFWELSIPFYYEVRQRGTTVVSRRFIGSGRDADLSFRCVVSTDGHLVALMEASSPDVVLALYDLNSQETWPGGPSDDDESLARQRGKTLLSRLQQSHPSTQLILSEDVPGSRHSKLRP